MYVYILFPDGFVLSPAHARRCCTCTPIQVAGWWRALLTTCGGHLFPAPGMAPRRRRARRGGLPRNSGERASELDAPWLTPVLRHGNRRFFICSRPQLFLYITKVQSTQHGAKQKPHRSSACFVLWPGCFMFAC